MNQILQIFLGSFAIYLYLNIGYLFAKINLKLYKNKTSNKWILLMLWPIASEITDSTEITSFIEILSESNYQIIMSFLWPLKIVWNSYVLLVRGLMYLIILISLIVFKIAVFFPPKIFRLISRKKLQNLP